MDVLPIVLFSAALSTSLTWLLLDHLRPRPIDAVLPAVAVALALVSLALATHRPKAEPEG